ncbi:DUF3164 family protein [Coraliomargarita sp. W4R72]
MQTNTQTAPEGFRYNAVGNLIHIDNIKEIDLTRDEIVKELIAKAIKLGEEVAAFKKEALETIQAFAELSAEKYGAKLGGKKGNITLTSFDGEYQIVRSIADRIAFDERILAAKSLIDECIEGWKKTACAEICTIVNHSFKADSKGNLSIGRILDLLAYKIEDPKWLNAMDAIRDAISVGSTVTYIRFYKRNKAGQYIQISLDPTEL